MDEMKLAACRKEFEQWWLLDEDVRDIPSDIRSDPCMVHSFLAWRYLWNRRAPATAEEPVAYLVNEVYTTERMHAEVLAQVMKCEITPLFTHPATTARPLTEEEILARFADKHADEADAIALAEHNRDYRMEAIGARHAFRFFKSGIRAIEKAHGIQPEEKSNGR